MEKKHTTAVPDPLALILKDHLLAEVTICSAREVIIKRTLYIDELVTIPAMKTESNTYSIPEERRDLGEDRTNTITTETQKIEN